MKRILLTCEYDGTSYVGWQRQINGLSVQQVIEDTLSECCRETIQVTGSSRTDAGVHANGQMIHFDTSSSIPPEKFPFVLNTMLPPDLRIQAGREVPPAFHARFLSCGKLYTYRIINNAHGSALWRLRACHIPVQLDMNAMLLAAQTLIGTHDCAAFQASGGTAKTTVRTIDMCTITRDDDLVTISIHGNAFPSAFEEAFSTLNRLALGPTAPPQGLELTKVDYPPEAFVHPEQLRWHTGNA